MGQIIFTLLKRFKLSIFIINLIKFLRRLKHSIQKYSLLSIGAIRINGDVIIDFILYVYGIHINLMTTLSQ